jgi:SHS2 domain-containing protein
VNFVLFHHGADIGVRGLGATPAEAFANAALALTAVITDPESVQARERVAITCEERELDYLLVAWLNALVYEMAVRNLLFGRFDVQIEGTKLRGVAWGEPVDRARHAPAVEVKGATLTELKVTQDAAGKWTAQCVVDV